MNGTWDAYLASPQILQGHMTLSLSWQRRENLGSLTALPNLSLLLILIIKHIKTSKRPEISRLFRKFIWEQFNVGGYCLLTLMLP